MTAREHRRARRVAVHYPAVIESIGQPEVTLHPTVASVYERVAPHAASVGTKLPGMVRDLSTNGMFLACDPPFPLLARVHVGFELPGYGAVEVVGWVLWRRDRACEIPDALGDPVPLPAGIGILCEAMPLEARMVIAKMAR